MSWCERRCASGEARAGRDQATVAQALASRYADHLPLPAATMSRHKAVLNHNGLVKVV